MTTTPTEKTTIATNLIRGMSTREGRALAKKLAPWLESCRENLGEDGKPASTIEVDITCSLIVRHAAKLTRLSVAELNRPLSIEEQDGIQTSSERLKTLVGMLGRDIHGDCVGVITDGDPRGHVVTIRIPCCDGDTWGGDGQISVVELG